MLFKVDTKFRTIAEAKNTLTSTLLEAEQTCLGWCISQIAAASSRSAWMRLVPFSVRVYHSKKLNIVMLTVYPSHICDVYTHFNFQGQKLVKFLKDVRLSSVIEA